MSAIEIDALTRMYGRRVGIEAMQLTVPEGAVFGFLGPNGAGKSTTIRVLLGFLKPTRGRAAIFGRDCWRDSARVKADTGYLPGDLRLYPWMTGGDALRIFGAIRRRDVESGGRALAERFALDLDVKVRKMSRGMRQKLGLILAMAHEPRLLVLDEPSSGLDPLMQDALRDHLQRQAREGRTVFFSSHTLSEVEHVCDRVAIVREGRLVVDDTLDALRERARRDVTIDWHRQENARREAPAFLTLEARDGMRWECSLDGSLQELLAWAAAQPLRDISIGRPDLESLFRRYYEEPGEPA